MLNDLSSDQVAGLHRRTVGAMQLATVHDGMLAASFADLVGLDPANGEALHRAALRPLPPRLSCNTFVIQTDERLILVDAGCGDTAPDAGLQGRGLAALGIAAKAVGTILITHLHRDHAGGLIDGAGNAAFPNAELVVHADDLAFWRDSRSLDRLRPSQKQDFGIATAALAAYAGRIRAVESGDVLPGIAAVPVPGHTPGHTAWLLSSEGERLMIWGDVVHFPAVQFAQPEVSVAYDVDSAAAAVSRRQLLARVADEAIPVAGVHLDFPCFGHVARAGEGFAYVAEP